MLLTSVARAFVVCTLVTLVSCARTSDNFAPRVMISSPAGGGVSQTKTPMIQGYVLDDTGVTRITVNQKNIPMQAGSSKIAKFKFQAKIDGAEQIYDIKAYDAAGHVGELSVPISVDNVSPKLSLKSFERIGKVIRISGVVTDNTEVAQVIVDGSRLNISTGKRVEFYAETTGIYADIEAYDTAGNKVNIRAQ